MMNVFEGYKLISVVLDLFFLKFCGDFDIFLRRLNF